MQLIWIGLSILAGYWVSEWPRRVFPAESRPVKPADMTDPESRRCVWLYHPLVGVLGVLLTLTGSIAAQRLAPELWERYLAFWGLFFLLGAFGAAVGAFELITGMSPDSLFFFSNSAEQRFYVDRERAVKVGRWRLVSCLSLNVMVFVACHLLRS